ncbi:hypothetical protein N9T81_01300 [Flavobacteriaceae bacterium]|nr:hypothetical protein [Flavobacteriaceae bacterium]
MKKIISLGVFAELLIFLIFFLSIDDISETFRYSARYSGRLSLIVYLYCFYVFSKEFEGNKYNKTKKVVLLFSVLHLIHFIYLAFSVWLNELPIIPYKLLGGFIAYVLIIIYPLLIDKIKKTIYHIVYFYYVGIVMAVTYLARIKGEFVGAPTELFHYFGFSIVILIFILFGYKMFKKS